MRIAIDNNNSNKPGKFIEIAALLGILFIGLIVRLEDYWDWKASPEIALFEGQPILTTFDGYYYLHLAKDLLKGNYNPIDSKRAVPDSPKRPFPPPLISVLAATVAHITPFSLNWIGAILPAFLGVMLALPLYGIGRFYGGPIMGGTAATMSLLSNFYVYRSGLGWFDTDCMNVTWSIAAVFFAMHFAVNTGKKRYLYFAGWLANYLMFLWWWDQTPQVVTGICIAPMAVAFAFYYRPNQKEIFKFISLLFLSFILFLWWKGWQFPLELIKNWLSSLQYISKDLEGIFPSTGASVSEQSTYSWHQIVVASIDSWPAFILSAVGILLLILKQPKASFFLVIPLLLASFSFLFANRFLVFLAPVLALGIGFVTSLLWDFRHRLPFAGLAAPLLIILIAIIPFRSEMANTYWPKIHPKLVQGINDIKQSTPENAVIWSWWDKGYPLIYLADRATIADGQIHGGANSTYNGIPLGTDNFRLAANFMQFYVERGQKGFNLFYQALGQGHHKGLTTIKQILSVSPAESLKILSTLHLTQTGELKTSEDWLVFFFPKQTRPVYLFLDFYLADQSYWWYWQGSWDITKKVGIHPRHANFYQIQVQGNRAANGIDFIADLKTGRVTTHNQHISLQEAVIYNKEAVPVRYSYDNKSNSFLEIYQPGQFASLHSKLIRNSTFNRLFIRHEETPYFKSVKTNTPVFQLWQVMADSI